MTNTALPLIVKNGNQIRVASSNLHLLNNENFLIFRRKLVENYINSLSASAVSSSCKINFSESEKYFASYCLNFMLSSSKFVIDNKNSNLLVFLAKYLYENQYFFTKTSTSMLPVLYFKNKHLIDKKMFNFFSYLCKVSEEQFLKNVTKLRKIKGGSFSDSLMHGGKNCIKKIRLTKKEMKQALLGLCALLLAMFLYIQRNNLKSFAFKTLVKGIILYKQVNTFIKVKRFGLVYIHEEFLVNENLDILKKLNKFFSNCDAECFKNLNMGLYYNFYNRFDNLIIAIDRFEFLKANCKCFGPKYFMSIEKKYENLFIMKKELSGRNWYLKNIAFPVILFLLKNLDRFL